LTLVQKRKSIKILPGEKRLLETLYLTRRTSIEQYEELPDELRSLTNEWNDQTGRNDLPGDVLHYMRSRRKHSDWPRLEGAQRKSPVHRKFTADETEILVDIYREHVLPMDLGSDAIGYNDEIANLIEREFRMRAGRRVPGHELNAKLTRLRKRGLLPKLGKQGSGNDGGFQDFDAI
jgi:hypothetical protein